MAISFYYNPATNEFESTIESLGTRFGLNEISTARKTLSPTKSYASIGTNPTFAPEEIEVPNWRDLIREEGVEVGPQVNKDGGRIHMKPGGIVEPGVEYYGGPGSGTASKPKGLDSPLYKALDAKGEKIAKHVYGTLDISNSQRKKINQGEITMDTKAVKWKEGDISVKSVVRGGHKVKEVVFKNKAMEKDFIKYLKLRAKQPMKHVVEYGNEWFAKNFPITKRQVHRAIPYLMKKYNINYIDAPKTESGHATRATRKTLDISSSILEEGRIKTAKTKILKDLNLKKKIDFAHRVSKAHMAKLGLDFSTDLVGIDSRIINQVIVKPSEVALNKLYRDQLKIFEELKNNPTDEGRTKLTNLNNEIKKVVNTTSGRLVGVIIDPNTLETSFEGVKKKHSLTKFIGEKMTMKNLAQLPPLEQEKFLTKQLTNAVNAEVRKGFVPNDFKKILSDKKSQEALLTYAKKVAPETIKKLKWAFKNPTSKVSMKLLSSPFALIGAGYLTYKSGLLDTVVKAETLEPRDKTQEASVGASLGEYLLGGAGIGVGTAISNYPKQAWELAKKAGKYGIVKPLAGVTMPGIQGLWEIGKSIKEKRLPNLPDVTDPHTWMNAAFWNWAVKEWGMDKTAKNFGESLKTLSTGDKARAFRNVVARAGLSPKAVRFISSRVAWPAAAAASVYDSYKDYQERKEFLTPERIAEAQKEEFDKEEPMFAQGGIASLMK